MAAVTRSRRPRPDDDEEEEMQEPRSRRRRVEDDEEDQDQERPRSRRQPEPDDEDQEDYEDAPRSRRPARNTEDDDEDPRRARRRRPGGAAGPAGRAGRRPGNSRPAGRVASGWGGYERTRAAASDFEQKYKPSSDGDVIALLEEEPFAAFARHWVDTHDGKRAYICPASLEVGEDEEPLQCPLCDVGDKANSPKAYINVVILRPGQRPETAVWEIGGSVSDQLQTINKSIGRRTRLTDIYLLASSSGSGLNTKYHLEPLFPDDLPEFDVKPLSEKQLSAFDLYDASLYEIPSMKELDRVADEIA